jgi:hypothetical protein
MIFIKIRDGMVHPAGIQKMAKDFQGMLSAGGVQVGIIGTEESDMIAVANNIKEQLEIRKFAVQMEEVLYVMIDQVKHPGNYISEAEKKEHKLEEKVKKGKYDDL